MQGFVLEKLTFGSLEISIYVEIIFFFNDALVIYVYYPSRKFFFLFFLQIYDY